MKKVYLVCGKETEESYNFWILAIYKSRKKAEWNKKVLDEVSLNTYHYIVEEPVW